MLLQRPDGTSSGERLEHRLDVALGRAPAQAGGQPSVTDDGNAACVGLIPKNAVQPPQDARRWMGAVHEGDGQAPVVRMMEGHTLSRRTIPPGPPGLLVVPLECRR